MAKVIPAANENDNKKEMDDINCSEKKLMSFPKSTLRHRGDVTSVAVTKDGSKIISGSRDKTVQVRSLSSGECFFTLEGHEDPVTSVAVTADGSKIISGSRDQTVKVWSLSNGKCLSTLEGHEGEVTSVTVTADGSKIISASWDKTVKVWNLLTGECLSTLEGSQGSIDTIAVSADGSRIISGGRDWNLKVWSLSIGECLFTLEGHESTVTTVVVISNCSKIVSGSFDRTLKIWCLSSGECLSTLEGHYGSVMGVAVTADGSKIISSSLDKTIKVWSLSSGECLSTLEGHEGYVTSVTVTADGSKIISGSLDILKIWSLSDCELLSTLEGHQGYVNSVTVAADGFKIISVSRDWAVKVWSLSNGECLSTLEGHEGPFNAVAVTTDGFKIISGGEKTVKVWNLSSGECLSTLEGHEDPVTSVTVTADGSKIISGSRDKTVKVWSLSSAECLSTLKGHEDPVTSVTVTADGSKIISGSDDKTVKVWSLPSGECLSTLKGHEGEVTSVAVTADGSKIISGSDDKTVKVWSLSSGECLSTLEGHRGYVNSVTVTADGSKIISGSRDWTVKVFSLFVHPDNSVVFTSLAWLVCQFTAHKGSELLIRHVISLFPKVSVVNFVSEDCERSSTYLCRAIELNAPDEMLEAFFKVRNPYPWLNLLHRSNYKHPSTPRNILELLMELKRERALVQVLDQIVFGFNQHNQVRMGKLAISESSWRVTPEITSSPDFTSFLCSLMEQYPQLAEEFLSKIGVVKTFVGVDARSVEERSRAGPETVISLKSCLPEDSGFLVVGRDSLVPVDNLWGDSLVTEGSSSFFHKSASGKSVQVVETRMLSFAFAGGDPIHDLPTTSGIPKKWRIPSLLHSIVKSNRPSLCGNATVRTLVQHKWQTFGQSLFLKEMCLYCFGLLLLMTLLFIRPDPFQELSAIDLLRGDPREQSSFAVTVVVILESLLTLSRECREMSVLGVKNYFQEDWKNSVDLTVILLTWLTCIGVLVGWKHHVVCLALALFLKWLGLLYFLQAFASTGPLVRMVFQIIMDMRHFTAILLVAVLASASSFYALLHHARPLQSHDDGNGGSDNPFQGAGQTLFFMFKMLLLGDFDTDLFLLGEYVVLLQVLFASSMTLTLIILLNLLIALMSDSYERIQDQAEIEFLMLRARMVVSMEKLMGEKELRDARDAGWFPCHYFVLVPFGDGLMSGLSSGDQWNGMLNALKSEIRELRDHLQEQGRVQQERGSASMKKEICDRHDSTLLKMDEKLGKSIGEVKGTIREMKESMGKLEGEVKGNLREVEDRVAGVEGRLEKMEETLQAILREVQQH